MGDIEYCYQEADRARQRALEAETESLRKNYDEAALRWISLARSYEFLTSLNSFHF